MMNWRVIYSGSGVSNKLSSLPGSSKFSHFCHGFRSIDLVWPIFWIPTNTSTSWHKLQSRDAPDLYKGGVVVRPRCWLGTWDHVRPGARSGEGRLFLWPLTLCSAQCAVLPCHHITHYTPHLGAAHDNRPVSGVSTPCPWSSLLHSFIGIYNFALTLVFSHVWWHWHALNIVFVCHFIVFYCRGANSH